MTLGKQSGTIVLTLQKKKEEEKEKEQQEQKPMKGGEPIIHCDRTSPLRLRLNPHRTAQRRQKKYKSTSRKNVLPRTWSRKKNEEERIKHD